MIIRRIQPLANDHPEDPTSCKWLSRGYGLLQMIIQRIRPLANDHLEDLASCKWSSGGTGLLQMIIRHPCHPNHLSQDPDSISRTFLEQFVLVSCIRSSPIQFMNHGSWLGVTFWVHLSVGHAKWTWSSSSFFFLTDDSGWRTGNLDMVSSRKIIAQVGVIQYHR